MRFLRIDIGTASLTVSKEGAHMIGSTWFSKFIERLVTTLGLASIAIFTTSCDSNVKEKDKILSEATEALLQCKQTICDTPFWDNVSCARAHQITTTIPHSLFETEAPVYKSDFFIQIGNVSDTLNTLYIFSLEQESGYRIRLPNPTRCHQGGNYRFDALENIMKN